MLGFIVDTDKYAGNFERQLCAVAMNAIGDCGVGSNFVDTWDEEDLSGYTRQALKFINNSSKSGKCTSSFPDNSSKIATSVLNSGVSLIPTK